MKDKALNRTLLCLIASLNQEFSDLIARRLLAIEPLVNLSFYGLCLEPSEQDFKAIQNVSPKGTLNYVLITFP
jgi:hypothetical protein